MTIKTGWTGRYYEDFEVGDVYPHPIGRTVTQTDNIWFTLLTVNPNPIHFDARICCAHGVWPAAGGLHFYAGPGNRLVGQLICPKTQSTSAGNRCVYHIPFLTATRYTPPVRC